MRDLSFHVRGGEKVGVGKNSLIDDHLLADLFFRKRDMLSIPFVPFGLTYYYSALEARREMDTSMKSSMLFFYINVNMFVFFYHSGPYRSGQV